MTILRSRVLGGPSVVLLVVMLCGVTLGSVVATGPASVAGPSLDRVDANALLTTARTPSLHLSVSPLGEPVGTTSQLRLNGLVFDPLAIAATGAPTDLVFTTREGLGPLAQEKATFIVQFDGPVRANSKADLHELGVEFFWYLPEDAFIVRAPLSAIPEVSSHPAVRAIVPYALLLKVHASLVGKLAASPSDQPQLVRILALENPTAVAEHIRAAGGNVWAVGPEEIHAQLPVGLVLSMAADPLVGWVEDLHAMEVVNDNAGSTLEVRQSPDGPFTDPDDALWSYDNATDSFDGIAGQGITVAVYDTGVDGTHPGYDPTNGDPVRKGDYHNYGGGADWTDNIGHGTHTTGSVLSNGKWRAGDPSPGTVGRYAGMAPRARLVAQAGLDVAAGVVYLHLNDALTSGANLTSNSWGDPGSHGAYTALSRNYDLYTRDADVNLAGNQQILSVIASGNEANGGVREPAVAKNVLTVGAVGDDRNGHPSDTIADFSSRGPTNDGRQKPDIVTPGEDVMSHGMGATSYTGNSGTSMATPLAAGSAALVASYWNLTYGTSPSPALLKALLINGAQGIPTESYPNSAQGWGRLRVANSVKAPGQFLWTQEEDPSFVIQTGFSASYPVTLDSQGTLKVTLAWTDAAGAANDPVPALVNDLDLRVRSPSGIWYWGNQFSGDVSVIGGGADRRNNVEGLLLPTAEAGEWTVAVQGFDVPEGPQDFVLVIRGDTASAVGAPTLDFLDLEATSLTVGGTLIEGEEVTFSGSFSNTGTKPAVGIFWHVLANGGEVSSGLVATLTDGQSAQVEGSWIADRGLTEVVLEVDPVNDLFELSEANNAANATITIGHYGVLLRMGTASLKTDPEAEVRYDFTIENVGDLPDTFDLLVESDLPTGWSSSFDLGDSVEVAPDQEVEANLLVTPAIDARAGEAVVVTLRVTSQGNGSYWQSAPTTTVVNEIVGLEVTLDPPTLHGIPGAIVTTEVTLLNSGNGPQRAAFSTEGVPDLWLSLFDSYDGQLEPQQSVTTTLRLTIGDDQLAGAAVTVQVGGSLGRDLTLSRPLIILIDQTYGHEVSIGGTQVATAAGESAQLSARLTNLGNGNETVVLALLGPAGWHFDIPATARLQPHAETVVDFQYTPSEDALAGPAQLQLVATGHEGARSTNVSVSVNQSMGLELSTEPLPLQLQLGSDSTDHTNVTVHVHNLGNSPQVVRLRNDALPGEPAIVLDETTRQVALGAFAEVDLVLTVVAGDHAGNFSLILSGFLVANPTIKRSVDWQLHVEAAARTDPSHPGDGGGDGGGGGHGGGDDNGNQAITALNPTSVWLILALFAIVSVGLLIAVMARNRRKEATQQQESALAETVVGETTSTTPPSGWKSAEEKEAQVSRSAYEQSLANQSTFDLEAHLGGSTAEPSVAEQPLAPSPVDEPLTVDPASPRPEVAPVSEVTPVEGPGLGPGPLPAPEGTEDAASTDLDKLLEDLK